MAVCLATTATTAEKQKTISGGPSCRLISDEPCDQETARHLQRTHRLSSETSQELRLSGSWGHNQVEAQGLSLRAPSLRALAAAMIA